MKTLFSVQMIDIFVFLIETEMNLKVKLEQISRLPASRVRSAHGCRKPTRWRIFRNAREGIAREVGRGRIVPPPSCHREKKKRKEYGFIRAPPVSLADLRVRAGGWSSVPQNPVSTWTDSRLPPSPTSPAGAPPAHING